MNIVEDHRMTRVESDTLDTLKTQSGLSHSPPSKQQGIPGALSKTDLSDGILLEQSLAGDERAFETLFHRYYRPLLNYIRRLLQDEEQAYDVLQFVFFQLYLSRSKLRTYRSLKGWLFHVARNRSVDEWRRRRYRSAIYISELSGEEGIVFLEAIQDPQPLPEEIVEHHDLHTLLQEAIRKLPPTLRRVVHLRCFGSLTFSEIGHTLKMPENTAKTYFYRALPLLRSTLRNSPAMALTS